ncbi:protein serine/threonine phosphatase 2C [Tothia fuscella]|uniref:Protein phosphatase n=1 Tax=Tothia fuscella TaxID=1048955 RepID=A0A9P4P4K3_9PEZI|nr:protein serine/threonine phosphatase 2C [Tothia fuscella]
MPSSDAKRRLSSISSHLNPPTPTPSAGASLIRPFSSSSRTSSASPTYTYSISAAYCDKKKSLNPAKNVYTFNPFHRVTKTASEISSKERKLARPNSGQDAFFVSNINGTGSVAFGVVDGVGGWETSGVDPADFAHSLCDYMASAAAWWPEGFKDQTNVVTSKELLDVGYKRVMEDKDVFAGGSTACVATASPEGVLEAANLGDSGYARLSPFRLNYISPPQTHAFNTPYQFSKQSPKMLTQVALFGGAKPYSELPSDAAVKSHYLNHGDVLVFATDGVWDNLSPEDALRIVSRLMVQLNAWIVPEENSTTDVNPDFPTVVKEAVMKIPGKSESIKGLSALLAAAITHEAKEASLNERRDGPFAKEVQRYYPKENWRGGKPDDICTVVAVVIKEGV